MRLRMLLAPGLLAAALIVMSTQWRSGALAEPRLFLDDAGPVIISDRPICSLVNSDAAAAHISGQDGGASILSGGKSYFIFADTGFTANPQNASYISNNIAVSVDTDASDCVSMTHDAEDGVAKALLDPLPHETAIWPDGLITAPDGDIWFFVGSVVPGPSPWWVRGVGLGRMDTTTLDGTREAELLWDADSGFDLGWPIGARGVTVIDGVVHLLLHTGENAVYLARVPLADVPDVDAYTYWTGSDWSAAPSQATPLWVQGDGFNGPALQWSQATNQWMAIYNPDLGRHVRVRTADALTGPWSAETEWIDCARFVAPWVLPMCYSSAFHPQFDRDGGRTMTISISIYEPYQVVLHEVRLGVPIYQWRSTTGETRLQAGSPGVEFTVEGIAFYASDVPAPGLGAVRRYIRPGGEQVYAFVWNELGSQQMGIAFYASPKANPNGANLTYDPVYRWDKDNEHIYSPLSGLEGAGYTRGPALFYGVCGDADVDAASDCLEDAQGTDPGAADSDGDGFGDRPANTANPNWVPSVDNCPATANASQTNMDGEPWLNTDGVQDWTNPAADALGDACDEDRDGDHLADAAETTAGTDASDPDTDGDFWPDGLEAACGSDPLDGASGLSGVDTDGDRVPDACEIAVGSNVNLRDSDGDTLVDSIEVRWLTDPSDADSDDDGWSDSCEVGTVNIDGTVNALDLMAIARRFNESGDAVRALDLNRDGVVRSTDLLIVAQRFGVC